MKSCLSLFLSFVIVIAFAGTAALLWYGSKTTKFSNGEEVETVER